MSKISQFLKPSPAKLVFLIEWTLFILIEFFRGEVRFDRSFLVASYPFLFFYLIACMLVQIRPDYYQAQDLRKLAALVTVLVGCDQISKFVVIRFLPYQASIPIIEGWLGLAHHRNLHGSWLVSVLGGGKTGTILITSIAFGAILLLIFNYRNNVGDNPPNFWIDCAMVCLIAGIMSWICDMMVRGLIVDFIHLPGLVTADFKDIYLSIGIGSLLAWGVDMRRSRV